MTAQAAPTEVTKTNRRSQAEWTKAIAAQWGKATDAANQAVEEAIKTGRMLADARQQLTKLEYGQMVRKTGMSTEKALYLRNFAASPIAKIWGKTSTALPSTWTALAELCGLDEVALQDAQEKGLIGPNTGAREARAVAGAYNTPEGEVIGEGRSGAMLPSPSQAKEIAKATGRTVAGSDGRYHTPMPEDDVADYQQRRADTYETLEAIEKIADLGMSADEWIEQTEDHWLIDFRLANVEAAAEWLAGLAASYKASNKVVENGH